MSVVVITPPDPIVTLADAKAHLRIDHTYDDAQIEGFIDAATENLDGPGGWLGRAIGVQTLELRRDRFSQCGGARPDLRSDIIDLPFPPITSVVSVKYIDTSGVEQTVSSSVYAMNSRGVSLAYNQSWPAIRPDIEGVKIRYVAGYEIVPRPIIQAILIMVSAMNENRSGSVEDNPAVESLLSPLRAWSV